jgi:hypothetical protein
MAVTALTSRRDGALGHHQPLRSHVLHNVVVKVWRQAGALSLAPPVPGPVHGFDMGVPCTCSQSHPSHGRRCAAVSSSSNVAHASSDAPIIAGRLAGATVPGARTAATATVVVVRRRPPLLLARHSGAHMHRPSPSAVHYWSGSGGLGNSVMQGARGAVGLGRGWSLLNTSTATLHAGPSLRVPAAAALVPPVPERQRVGRKSLSRGER